MQRDYNRPTGGATFVTIMTTNVDYDGNRVDLPMVSGLKTVEVNAHPIRNRHQIGLQLPGLQLGLDVLRHCAIITASQLPLCSDGKHGKT